MKQFDFEKKKTEGFKAIVPGGYKVKILAAGILQYDWGEVLKLDFDIVEGEFTEYYLKQYANNSNEDRKWQGTIRVTVPNEGNQYFESQKKKFGNMIACIEESNEGYIWDWNEESLKNKLVGLVFGNEEYSFNGFEGWKAKPQYFISCDDVENGNYKVPKDKALKKDAPMPASNVDDFVPVDDEDLPF